MKMLLERLPFKLTAEIGLVFFVLVNALMLKAAYLFQFDPNDYGGFMDVAWRILHGQKPYIDFPFYLGPFYFYELAGFIALLGFNKYAVLAHMILTSSLAILASYAIFRNRLSTGWLWLVMGLTAAGFHWHTPFPHFTMDSHLWGLMGVAALFVLPEITARKAFTAGMGAGIWMVIAFMTKINVGVAYGGLYFLIMLASARRIPALTGALLGAALGAGFFFLFIDRPDAFYKDVFVYYLGSQTGRFTRFVNPLIFFTNGHWVPVLWVSLHLGLNGKKISRVPLEWLVLFYGLFGLAIFTHLTGSLFLPTYIPLMGILVGLAVLILNRLEPEPLRIQGRDFHKWTYSLLSAFGIFMISACTVYAFRTMSDAPVQESVLLRTPRDYQIKAPAFRGWHTIKQIGSAIDELDDYIRKNIPKNESLLIITNLQCLYGLADRESFRGVTFQFNVNDQPAPGKQTYLVGRHIMTHSPDWIITHRDKGRRFNAVLGYLGLENFLLANYRVVYVSGFYAVFRRMAPGVIATMPQDMIDKIMAEELNAPAK